MTTQSHKTRTLWLVGALHAFTHIYHVALLPLYLLIQRDLGLASVGRATLLVTVQMLGYYVPSYFMGVLADRVSRRQLLGWGLVINGLGFVGLSLAPNYSTALACAVVTGVGGSFYHPAATAMIARLFPNGTGKALGLIGMGAGAGFFFGPLYSGWRAVSAGWRAPVLELGLFGIGAALIFFWLADEEPATTVTKSPQAEPPMKMFPTPALWVFFLAAAAAFSLRDFAGNGVGTLNSLFLQHTFDFTPQETGRALSCIFLVAVISNPLFGHLSDGGRRRWAALVLCIAAMLVAVFPHVPRAWLLPVLAAYGFFFMGSFPIVEATLMESVPDRVRGRVFGLFITIGGLVGNLSHWIIGEWVKRLGDAAGRAESYFGLYAGLALLIVLCLAGLPCLHAIRRREHLGEKVTVLPPSNAMPTAPTP